MSEVVMSGVASEYVLGDLADYLRERGHRVHEFDFAHFKGDAVAALKSLDGSQCTYITSAHTNLSMRVTDLFLPLFSTQYPNYLAPLEIMGILRPRQSVYVPHDLLAPYGDVIKEYSYLDLFDHILAPFPAPAMQALLGGRTKVHTAGWIKNANKKNQALRDQSEKNTEALKSSTPEVALFISNIEYLRSQYGDQGVYDYFSPLLNSNVQVKLPDWNGVKALEALFEQGGNCQIFPSTSNSMDLIEVADIIICNGASSIHAEAHLLGRPAICLLDDEGITALEQKEKLLHFPNIYFHDYRKRDPISVELFIEIQKLKKPHPASLFNFEIVHALIETEFQS
jgi:hypothetical protein